MLSAGVAQQVEQLICNQQVAGSNPIASSSRVTRDVEGFPSGQREQTVNLPAKPTEVRILPPPPYFFEEKYTESMLYEAGVAQWLERQPSKLRVAGSNPVSRSKEPIEERPTRFPAFFGW